MPPDFPEARLRRAGLGAARIAALHATYDGWGWSEQAEFRRIVGSRTDEVIRRVYDPGGAPDAAMSAAQVAADPALLTAVQAAILAAHDTDAERETFIPARLAEGTVAPYRAGLSGPTSAPVRVVSTCDSGWTQLDATVTHDATVADAGSASLKLTAPASNKAQAQLTFTAQDWSTSAFGIRLRFDDRASVSDGYILLSTSGTFAQYFRAQYTPKLSAVTNGEWHEFTLTRDDFDFNSGTADWTTVNGIRIQVYSNSSATPSLWVDQIIRYPAPPRPTVSLCFDDGFATTASVAKPKLDQYGYRGSAFFIAQRLGANGYLTQTQIDTLAQAGWDICGHGDTNLTTLSLAAAEADVLANKRYLVDHGYKGADVYAYPNDGQNFAVRTMVAKYFGAARGLSTFGQTRAYVPRRRFQGYQAGTARSVATVNAWLDAGIATNSWMVLTFHNLPNSTSLPEDYLPADFASVIDHIAAAGVQVLPVSEALAASDAPPIMRAPNGNRYRLDVDNTGAIVTSLI